jgi:hypothetical protein
MKLALYLSYLDNRYFRTAIYNDSNNSKKVSSWAKVRYEVTQGSILEALLFLLYINDFNKSEKDCTLVCMHCLLVCVLHSIDWMLL